MITFISYNELIRDAGLLSEQLPKHDIVCAIPRSGFLPAQVIAERWGVPLTTPELLSQSFLLNHGSRMEKEKGRILDCVSVLILDDTVHTGREMERVKNIIAKMPIKPKEVTYACVYGSITNPKLAKSHKQVPQPRIFEWNWLHHQILQHACFDIDGVLCRPPTPQENDYGPNYERFLEETEPRYIPSKKIRAIITGRLETYRPQTEAWLKKHNVQYGRLIMRKDRTIPHVQHKANNLVKFSNAFFVEDEVFQAQNIHVLTRQPVLCVANWKVYQEGE